MSHPESREDVWPALPWASWRETCAHLHLRTQVVGKVRLALAPWLNHSWHATLYVTARGLSTSLIPHGARSFSIDFDLVADRLRIQVSDGRRRDLPLGPDTIAAFTSRLLEALGDLDLQVHIHGSPSELPDALPFREDHEPRPWDREAVKRYWQILVQVERVMQRFRTGFVGKSSPVHLFWGALDLAVTRFSGRRAPLHAGGMPGLPDAVAREAYSHELSSAGFWPGGMGHDDAAFYAYAWPAPAGYPDAAVQPAQAYYHAGLGEFVLPYETVRAAAEPEEELLRFLQSTYEAAASLGGWDRAALECPLGVPLVPRPL